MRDRKNGTPRIEVIIPAGSSAGAMIVRATVSEIRSKIAPHKTESGINRFACGPASRLTI